MKKILVTGNSGYIGSHLTKALARDYEVWGLDVNSPLATVYDHYYSDIKSTLLGKFNRFDAVVHLAALVRVGESKNNPYDYYDTNINGTMRVVGLPCDNFIFASTGCAPQCASPYAVSKLAGEQVVQEYCKSDYTIFRFYNVIGSAGFLPTNPDGLMSKLQQAAITGSFTLYGTDYNTRDGTAIRDYVHVQEICSAIILAIETPSNSIENLGHGTGYTVKEIVDQFKTSNEIDFEVISGPRRQGDLESSVLDKPSRYMKRLYSMKQLLIV